MKLINIFNKVILIILILFFFINNVMVVMADDLTTLKSDDFKPGVEEVPDDIIKIGGTIYNAITTVGIIVAVITLIILGIKYMLGSVEEKAEYKKTFIPYIIGAILIGGGSTMVIIIQEMVG